MYIPQLFALASKIVPPDIFLVFKITVAPLVYMFKPVRVFGMELTTFDM